MKGSRSNMKILMINKFLYPKGGSETYMLSLGSYLQGQGHEVQYFGMEDEKRCVGNNVGAYTSNMDFHSSNKLARLTYPFKTIYNAEARKKIRQVLDDLCPDVCHINNFNYQLTPSIILEIDKWREQTGHKCRIVYTAHDYQLVCPDHMCHNPNVHKNCEKCLGGHFINCIRGRCIHGSIPKSIIGAAEGAFWKRKKVYGKIDTVICCSHFMKSKLDSDSVLASKTVVMHNFTDCKLEEPVEKKDYVLYFGRYSQEKGIRTLIQVCEQLPDIPFVFAGDGPLKEEIKAIPNIKNVGFLSGDKLKKIIRAARFSVYPSEWYENGPFSVMESLALGTPVIGADIGGIPELVLDGVTGMLFESGNAKDLTRAIHEMFMNNDKLQKYEKNCRDFKGDTLQEYCDKLLRIYNG